MSTHEEQLGTLRIDMERMMLNVNDHLGGGAKPGRIYEAIAELRQEVIGVGQTVHRLHTQMHGGEDSMGMAPRMHAVEQKVQEQTAAVQKLTEQIKGSDGSPGLVSELRDMRKAAIGLEKLHATVMVGTSKDPSVMTLLDRIQRDAERTSKLLWIVGGAAATGVVKAAFDYFTSK